ncbi:H1FOO protein, partial [Mionectes macconnelli]|nr:H1FOO protein [Mionectes macconnelli]
MVPLPAAKAAGEAQLPGPLVLGRVARCPATLQMVKEALQAQNEKKGASVFTIEQFILTKYPSEDPIRLKYLPKQALSKGLSRGELVRPHNSSAVGATGTFMVSRGCQGGWGPRCCLGPTDTLLSPPASTHGAAAHPASRPGKS